MRVPCGQGVAFDRSSPTACIGIGGVPDGQSLVGRAGVEQCVAHHPSCRGTLVVIGRMPLERRSDKVPVTEIGRAVKSTLVGREQKVLALIGECHGVGRRSERAPLTGVVVPRLVVVADVERIAVGCSDWVARIVPGRCLCGTTRLCDAGRGLIVQHHVDCVLTRPACDRSHLLARIVDAQVLVAIGANQGVTALGIGVAVCRAMEPHDRGALNGPALCIGDLSRDIILRDDGDVVVADLPVHHAHRVGCGTCGTRQHCCQDGKEGFHQSVSEKKAG